MSVFYSALNDVVKLTLASSYTPGSGSLVLSPGQAVQLGSPSPSAPLRICVITAATYGQIGSEIYTIYPAMAVSGNTVTIGAPIEGTSDRYYSPGDFVEVRWTAGYISDLNSAVAAIQGSTGTVTSVSVAAANGFSGSVATPLTTPVITLATGITGVLKGTGTGIVQAAAGTDYVLPSGSITGSAGTITGSITQSQVTNLTTNLVSLSAEIAAAGTITSVGLTAPAWITVTGSPVTSSGTIGIVAAGGQAANSFLASPSGSSGALAPRAIVAADLPLLGASGTRPCRGSRAGPGSSAGTSRFLREDATWAAPSGGGGSGTVTSVSLTMPGNFAVAGSPVTSSGTLAVTATTPAITVFTTSGTFSIPTGATFIEAHILGAGGGGGSGARQASGTAAYGGGGGSGGPALFQRYRASDLTALGSSITVTVGAEGTGGTAPATDSTNGAAGSSGGNTTLAIGSTTIASVRGSGGGAAGTATGGGYGGSTQTSQFAGNSGGASSISATAGAGGYASPCGPGGIGGGGGGGLSAGGTAYGGGFGGYAVYPVPGTEAAGGTGGTSGGNGSAGASPVSAFTGLLMNGGGGGGGGACSSSSGTPGTGGAGAAYGAGGGGGGAMVNGVTLSGGAGNGGAGGPAIVVLVAW